VPVVCGGVALNTRRFPGTFELIAAAVWVSGCGPSAVANRVVTESDPARPIPGESVNQTPAPNPEQPPPANASANPPIDSPRAPNGFSCKDDRGCVSLHCVDGVCCQTACPGVCESCDQAENVGRCLPVPAGQDPDEECAEEAPATCGRDGACDGAGACRFHPAGSVCTVGSCEMATERAASLCDGKGVCVAGPIKSCAPAECMGDACAPPCAIDADCPMGRWCDSGTCRNTREQGGPCVRAAQCGSGFCTDGVCCNMACNASCYACNLEGAVGVCKAIPSGQDPARECRVEAIGTCGNLGGCNGRGACTKHPQGTFCGHGSCVNRTQFGQSTCDGMGGCRRGPGVSCGNFTCNGNLVCWNACADNAQCAPGRTCNIHNCE
jgi:hypothetical protein